MIRYSLQPRDWIFVKGYRFFSYARNMGKNIAKNKSENLKSKYNQKVVDHTKQSATDAIKTASKRAIQNLAEATGNLIGNKIAVKLQDSENLCHRIIQKQMKNKCFEKDAFRTKT